LILCYYELSFGGGQFVWSNFLGFTGAMVLGTAVAAAQW
jgi:hypothetical protein